MRLRILIIVQVGLILYISGVVVHAESRRDTMPPPEPRRPLLAAPIDAGENIPPYGITGPIAGTVNTVHW